MNKPARAAGLNYNYITSMELASGSQKLKVDDLIVPIKVRDSKAMADSVGSCSDVLYLNAALGWFGLGDFSSALEELDKISPEWRAHPVVLRRRWEIHCRAKAWEAALEVALELTEVDPDDDLSWLNVSFALHELKRTVEARDNLLEAIRRFPNSPLLRYNLPGYECALGDVERAAERLRQACALPGGERLLREAKDDPDLRALWEDRGETLVN